MMQRPPTRSPLTPYGEHRDELAQFVIETVQGEMGYLHEAFGAFLMRALDRLIQADIQDPLALAISNGHGGMTHEIEIIPLVEKNLMPALQKQGSEVLRSSSITYACVSILDQFGYPIEQRPAGPVLILNYSWAPTPEEIEQALDEDETQEPPKPEDQPDQGDESQGGAQGGQDD